MSKQFEIDDSLLSDLIKYVEGSLPVHKRVGGALDQRQLLDRLQAIRSTSPPRVSASWAQPAGKTS